MQYRPGVHTEWRVTGDAGPDFPPYDVTLRKEADVRALVAEETAFARNVTDIKVHRRTVTVTEWERVDVAARVGPVEDYEEEP